MRYTTLIFDLDGTLSDPALGVVRCMNFALTSFDQPPRADHEIKRHIGPPLEQILALLIDNDDPAYVSALAARYRERYAELGYRENTLYPFYPFLVHAAGLLLYMVQVVSAIFS